MSVVVLPEKCFACDAEIPRRLVSMETIAAFVMEVVWCPECGLEQPKRPAQHKSAGGEA